MIYITYFNLNIVFVYIVLHDIFPYVIYNKIVVCIYDLTGCKFPETFYENCWLFPG